MAVRLYIKSTNISSFIFVTYYELILFYIKIKKIIIRRPRWPCVANLITRQVSSQLIFGSRGEVQHRFSKWWSWVSSWLYNRNVFSFFYLQVTSILPMKFRINTFWVKMRNFEIDFQDGSHGTHLRCPRME